MTDESLEYLWYKDTIRKLKKIKVFYSHEQYADGTIRVKPFVEYILLTAKRTDVKRILDRCSIGHVILFGKGRQYTTYYILRSSGLKGDDLEQTLIHLKGFSIKSASALEIKPQQFIDTKYSGLLEATKNKCKKLKMKPYQILLGYLHNLEKENCILFAKPRNKQLKVSLPFPQNEGGSRTQRAFVAQFERIKTPYQFLAHFVIPYHLICQTQLLFAKTQTYRVRVSIDYIKSLLPKSRNLTMQNLINLVNTADFMTCEKVEKYLFFNFKGEFIEGLKKCKIINTDLTFIIGGAAFAGKNLGSTPESIKALLLFLAAVQSHNFLKISMSNFFDITGFSAKSRNAVASINRILNYLYSVGVVEYMVQINRNDLKFNSILNIKLR